MKFFPYIRLVKLKQLTLFYILKMILETHLQKSKQSSENDQPKGNKFVFHLTNP